MNIWSNILKAPLVLLVFIATGVAGYVAYKGIRDISWGAPIILGVICALYIVGVLLGRKKVTEELLDEEEKE